MEMFYTLILNPQEYIKLAELVIHQGDDGIQKMFEKCQPSMPKRE